MAEDRRSIHLLIKGRVQGVGYRDWMSVSAKALGLDGWVRNLRTGEVEAVIAGPLAAVERLIGACHIGPPSARVSKVELADTEPPSPGFRRLPTA